MMLSLNCLFLGSISISEAFTVDVCDENDIDGKLVTFKSLKFGHLKYLIREKKKEKLHYLGDTDHMKLWKVDITFRNRLNDITEEQIKNIGVELFGIDNFQKIFISQDVADEFLIIIQVPATTVGPFQQGIPREPNWNDPSSIYKWMQQFNLNPGRNRLVQSFGMDFEFHGRDNAIDTLWNGDKVTKRKGIVDRFPVRKSDDKDNHPIPVLAAGPGTGKSRFLDEVERLLTLNANNADNEDIRNAFSNLVVINTTYGNGSPANNLDIIISRSRDKINDQLSLAMRILFEYFRPQPYVGEFTFSSFRSLCNNYSAITAFTLDTALQVVYADIIIRKNQEINSNPLLVLVLGIDEFNKLHDTDENVCKDLIKSIGGVLCKSPANIFFIPILAGTIEGPLDRYITDSRHKPLRLPLYLLSEDHAIGIGKAMNLFDDNYIKLHPYFRISIGDIGGHVRALESFYDHFKDTVNKKDPEKKNPNVVNIDTVINCVRTRISNEYGLVKYSKWMAEVLAKAILNQTVHKTDKIKLDDELTSYQDLSSMGIINLVLAEKMPKGKDVQSLFYIRIPYMWASILVQHSNYPGMDYWKPMFDYDEPMYWQNFERFNARFWALRLSLFRLLNDREKINFKDLLLGAKFSREFPNGEVFLSKYFKVCKLRHRYPGEKKGNIEGINSDDTRYDDKTDTKDIDDNDDMKDIEDDDDDMEDIDDDDDMEDIDDDDDMKDIEDDDDDTEDDGEMDVDKMDTENNEKDGYTKTYIRLESLDYPNAEDMSLIYLNAGGASFDIFKFFKYGANYTLCLAMQVKITDIDANKPMIINQTLFNKEYKKVTKAMEYIPANEWVLLFLTNAKANSLNVKNKKNSALVTEIEFRDFYGYTFASRAQFMSANEKIFINSTDEDSLRILGFNEKERRKICEERQQTPLLDYDDIKDRIKISANKFRKLKRNDRIIF